MNKSVGIWLDNKKAVVVSISDAGEARRFFTSDMEHYVRFSESSPGDGNPEDARDKRYWNHLGEFYSKIIEQVGDARAIQIFGPGEAKFALQRQMGLVGMANLIVSMDDAEALSDAQIIAKVRERFPARPQYSLP